TMKRVVEGQPNLTLRQEIVEALVLEDRASGGRQPPDALIRGLTPPARQVVGVMARGDTFYGARAVVFTTGTFLKALMHTGEAKTSGGRAGDQSAEALSDSLAGAGFTLARFKTGTPCRLNGRTIDFDKCEPQP